MKKAIFLAIVGLLLLVGILAGIKTLQIRKMIARGAAFAPPPVTVTTAQVTRDSWERSLTAVGSLSAVQGVTVAADQPGKVVGISFSAGARVQKGTLLLQQDISSEQAQLPGAEAKHTLAKSNLQRARQLFDERIISRAELDAAQATERQAQAAVDNLGAAIAKKTIRAPFSGRLGIRLVNLGQMLREGDSIVSLQVLDPIFVDFSLPQQQLSEVKSGFTVQVTSDAIPGQALTGRVTAINPEVDPATRNIRLQGTLVNPGETLRPGMYVNVAVQLPGPEQVLMIPATAVLYAPYGDSVFVVEPSTQKQTGQQSPASGEKELVLRQQFVKLGDKRGDYVAVDSGVKEGEQVVSTGVFKLRNGQSVVVDNTLQPEFKLAPKPGND
jgi:membrane fusion protein, multidrug efflux system